MTTIYLIRHGEIATGSPRRFIGRQDLGLTARGREQIATLASSLRSAAIDRIISSPLLRCRQSAAILASTLGCPQEVEQDFAEIDLGAWEGLTVREVEQRFPGAYEARGRDLVGYRPPAGESFADLRQRVWPALTRTAAAGPAHLAVVAHAGVNRVLLCQLLGMPPANLFRLEQGYGCCNLIHLDQDRCRLGGLNIQGR
ncbi:alpha-ribazole phosphatase [Desulfogranum mediterraneum]|uniref:alpha-ribazole phosphatase n=1 Tax=Desulfogranum mediterraneum TaxID=160661 RepID=UPI00041DC8E1|nr:alpha-ribazole phosphatase [Desulfogranum mediterraneum]